MKIKNLLITLVLCVCGIANASENSNEPKLKAFALESMGIALNAPESWSDFSKEGLFQVIDEETNTQFTASVYDNSKNFTPLQWAELRFGIVNSKMTYLKYDNLASEVKADSWYGIAGEFSGIFPNGKVTRKYVVLAIVEKDKLYSFTIVADEDVYKEHKFFYQNLIRDNLKFTTRS